MVDRIFCGVISLISLVGAIIVKEPAVSVGLAVVWAIFLCTAMILERLDKLNKTG